MLRRGNTVEGDNTNGVRRILSDGPIQSIDLPVVDDLTIEEFRWEPDQQPSFDDFGGLSEIVSRAQELIELPLEQHEALAAIGATPIKGVLFTGEPGTGKTMLARIIANRAGATFYKIDGPQVVNKWLGQSEELVRKIFEDAATRERAIIFIDEIDSLAGQRGDNTHEATHRLVGQLLVSMDGFDKNDNVIVIAATNRPDDIDVALRRPGRFDWELHFPPPPEADRVSILVASGRRLVGGSRPSSRVDRVEDQSMDSRRADGNMEGSGALCCR